MMRASLSLFLVAAALSAQTVTIPVVPQSGIVNQDRPFAGGAGRFQQWYSPIVLQGVIPEPRRITGITFRAGSSQTSTTTTIDCEIVIGHGRSQGLLGTYNSNWDDPQNPGVVVWPRANVLLSATTSGSVCLTAPPSVSPFVPFATPFTWDGVKPLLLEIRVFGNGVAGSNPFPYNCQGTVTAPGVTRMYTSGSAFALSGTPLTTTGLITDLVTRVGANVSFGNGCPGEGGIVPRALVGGLAWPGVTWNHQIQQAASQQTALWVVGDQAIAAGVLDVPTIFGLPPANCFLRTSVANIIPVITVGGGAGGGTASLAFQLPATTGYIGLSFFTQWVVLDPLAPSGVVSVTNAIRSIVAPVGG